MTGWQPIATAPKDGTKVDLWGKFWRSTYDDFAVARFPDCFWMPADSITNRPAKWAGLTGGWCPTHWMPLPEPPA